MRLHSPLATAAFALAICGSVFAQDPGPPRRDAVLAGIVVAADSGRPLRLARVTVIGGQPRVARSVRSDNRGHFEIASLPSGDFLVKAEHDGYLGVNLGEKRPGAGGLARPVSLSAGQRLEKVEIALPRGGMFGGTVTDDFGDPAIGADVRALRLVAGPDGRRLALAGAGKADDRGIYRIAPLPPGDYLISMSLPDRPDAPGAPPDPDMAPPRENKNTPIAVEHSSIYFPGTTMAARASVVTLGVSEERGNLDINFEGVRSGEINGLLVTPNGSPPRDAKVQLLYADPPLSGIGTRPDPADAHGTFAFMDVAPGRYVVLARASLPGRSGVDATLYGRAEIVVSDGTATNLTLQLERGPTVTGSIVFDGGAPNGRPQPVTIALQPAASDAAAGANVGSLPAVQADARGRFAITDVMPGRYTIAASGLPSTWILNSAVFAGRDALDDLLDVRPGESVPAGVLTFTTRITELDGWVRDGNGAVATDRTVIVFPTDSRFWTPQSRHVQAVQLTSLGRFAFSGLPPGEYRLAVVFDPENAQWYDPAFLRELLAASVPITLGAGEKKTQDLSTGR